MLDALFSLLILLKKEYIFLSEPLSSTETARKRSSFERFSALLRVFTIFRTALPFAAEPL